ncbi:MAG: histidine triad nucleotide-binding protein [Candidatus Kapaibacteriota bacterium]
MANSIFTKIIKREIPADIVFENEEIIAIKDINPQAPVHILIIPKKEIPTINDLTAEDLPLIGKLVDVARQIAKEKGIEKDGYRLVFNVNEGAGQTVFHIHLHLIGGRKMNWPPG